MSRVPRLSHYAGYVYLCTPLSSKHIIRHASRHLWPGSEAFQKIGGVLDFNEDNEVDRLALSFLNDNSTVNGMETNDLKQTSLRGEYTYNQIAKDLKKLIAEVETPNINHFEKVADVDSSINFNVKEVLANTEVSVTNLDQSNNNQNNSNVTLKGAYKNYAPKLNQFAPEIDKAKGLSNNRMELNHEDYLNPVYEEDKQQNLKEFEDIPTYKPFQTIDVPVDTPNKKKTIVNNMSADEVSQQKEIQTVLDDTNSRILMRYALMQALYVLESGGTHCKAKIIFRSPKKN